MHEGKAEEKEVVTRVLRSIQPLFLGGQVLRGPQGGSGPEVTVHRIRVVT